MENQRQRINLEKKSEEKITLTIERIIRIVLDFSSETKQARVWSEICITDRQK